MLPITKQKASIVEAKLFQIRNTHVLNALRRRAWKDIEARNTALSKK